MSPTCPVRGCPAGTSYSKYKCRCGVCRREHKRHYDCNRNKIQMKMKQYYLKNKLDIATYKKRWGIDNRDKSILRRQLARYGLSMNDYERMKVAQNNLCAICRQKQIKGFRLSIDHEHTTGKVRGLLCNHCNFGIGSLKESIPILVTAIKYILRGGINVNTKI